MDAFLTDVTSYMKAHEMLPAGSGVIAGVSGGADSVALLRVLALLRGSWHLTVRVVHVEHGIRGEASRADARFVQELGASLGIPVEVITADVPEIARREGRSEEEAGRMVRYRVFHSAAEKMKRETGAPVVRIAVAHTANDNAETMLFHLARGTGLDGLAGIPPVQGDVIRPLLAAERSEIEVWLETLGQEYRTDATNDSDDYSRNRLRHQAVPALTAVNQEAVRHMLRTAELVRKTADYVGAAAEEILAVMCRSAEDAPESLVSGETPVAVISRELGDRPQLLRTEVLHRWLAQAAGGSRDLTAEHIASLDELLFGRAGRHLDLPYHLTAVSGYRSIALYEKRIISAERGMSPAEEPGAASGARTGSGGSGMADETSVSLPDHLAVGDTGRVRFGGSTYEYRLREACGGADYSSAVYTKSFDYDKISHIVRFRRRAAGDTIAIHRDGRLQSLKKYFINAKIPAGIRDTIPLVCDGSRVMWIVGCRMGADYQVSGTTSRILEIRRVDEDE